MFVSLLLYCCLVAWLQYRTGKKRICTSHVVSCWFTNTVKKNEWWENLFKLIVLWIFRAKCLNRILICLNCSDCLHRLRVFHWRSVCREKKSSIHFKIIYFGDYSVEYLLTEICQKILSFINLLPLMPGLFPQRWAADKMQQMKGRAGVKWTWKSRWCHGWSNLPRRFLLPR